MFINIEPIKIAGDVFFYKEFVNREFTSIKCWNVREVEANLHNVLAVIDKDGFIKFANESGMDLQFREGGLSILALDKNGNFEAHINFFSGFGNGKELNYPRFAFYCQNIWK